MKKKMMMINLNQTLIKEIEDYCKLNALDIDNFVNGLLKKGFLLEKYGEKPDILITKKTENKNQNETKIIETDKSATQNKERNQAEGGKVIPGLNDRIHPRKPINTDIYGE